MSPIEKLDRESCYRAVKSRDRRFDGVFYTAVRTTGIYCRPSCPARTPALVNVTFHPSAASAQAAGYRACKRCLPDATPGSPDWDVAADAAGRAMRLIADGVVDREGVPGLAAHLGYTSRHLSRLLTAELGAGPLALARAKRAQTARVLIETTELTYADIAFAAGFASVRQFNETIREVYASTPTDLRGRRGGRPTTGTVAMRLAVRTPYAGSRAAGFPGDPGDPGRGGGGRRLVLPDAGAAARHGHRPARGPRRARRGETAFATATFALDDLRDTAAAVERVRRMLDADCDPVAVADAFAGDRRVGPLVRGRPGCGCPATSTATRSPSAPCSASRSASPARAPSPARLTPRTAAGSAAARRRLTHLFPDAATLAALDPEELPMPRARGRALVGLCAALADGSIALDRGADRGRRPSRTAGAAGHRPLDGRLHRPAGARPPRRLPADRHRHPRRPHGPRRGPGRGGRPRRRWRPWRSYAQLHLWQADLRPSKETDMWTLMDSPVGELRIVEQVARSPRSSSLPTATARRPPRGDRDDDNPCWRAVRQLTAYFARELKEFDLPLAPHGTAFQQKVWERCSRWATATPRRTARSRTGSAHQRRLARGRAGQRPQPDPDRHPVPPGHRRQRHPDRLRRRWERKQTLLELEQDALF